ncbi:tRNA threonylcarbamoyladenosine biosynthesis protein TsaB [Chitinophaga skermanii]|uniref:N(6)-L-threonylcarbamoyladenine synthase n=1 Tax=Chitinophaga skermanii TaxID=331697 RepID=A0A327QHP8_9BACT|nr:tRNA (adenosine(37)-N6)-threonylcarbamoyltransferase complex dimerization subunit type 1 TsaB [Chitinophaga skermanii]RAJ03871.1 tRNA threonylcarbamoyladenosine biosynthesis protein TsaB [Chitinophaga skermanii]
MALLLNIDTATTVGSVCLSKDGEVLETIINQQQRDHAASMVLLVQTIMKNHGITQHELDAIAVSAGPGSYTGLRVGVATAKGLCYTWDKPLVAISTLQMMAQGMLLQQQDQTAYYVPMIDARRMEVFTAVYDATLQAVEAPSAHILEPSSYQSVIAEKEVYFFGDGAAKWQTLLGENVQHAHFPVYEISAAHMVPLAEKAFQNQSFANLAYFGPDYLKAFYHPSKK